MGKAGKRETVWGAKIEIGNAGNRLTFETFCRSLWVTAFGLAAAAAADFTGWPVD
jgi:hypothetical protein